MYSFIAVFIVLCKMSAVTTRILGQLTDPLHNKNSNLGSGLIVECADLDLTEVVSQELNWLVMLTESRSERPSNEHSMLKRLCILLPIKYDID
jgi:hypothetical protein